MAHMARLVPATFLLFGPLPSLAIDPAAPPLPSGFFRGLAVDRRPVARRLGLWGEILESAAKAGTKAAERAAEAGLEAAQRAAARKAAVELAASAAARDAADMLASHGVNEQLAQDLVGKATEAAKVVAEDAKKGALSSLTGLEAEACEVALANISQGVELNMTVAAKWTLLNGSGSEPEGLRLEDLRWSGLPAAFANISQAIKLNMTTEAERALLSGNGSEPEGRRLGGLSSKVIEKVAEAIVGGLLEGFLSCEDSSEEDRKDSTAAADDEDATGGLVVLGILGIAGSIYYYRHVHQKRQLENSATGSKTSQAPDQEANEQAV